MSDPFVSVIKNCLEGASEEKVGDEGKPEGMVAHSVEKREIYDEKGGHGNGHGEEQLPGEGGSDEHPVPGKSGKSRKGD